MPIDTHAHINFEAFNRDHDEVIKRSLAEDIWMVNVGSKYSTSKKAVEIAERYGNGVYAAVGLHPIHARDEEFSAENYKELAKSKKVVAIGEIGLDYFKDYGKFKDIQKRIFLKQLNLAKELNLPVIIHCRMAHEDLLEILNFQFSIFNFQLKGVIHCFTGNWQQAKEYLDIGFYLGFNGIIYKLDLKEVIKKTPLERILLETDCPYLTPPQEGDKRNEPVFVKYVAREIAKIKNISFKEVAKTTTRNAQTLFEI
ncbi:MAG: TatD family deoxyribonuclease [Candidatus Nealsonbacteria bacterium]|nr:TatD family deoxyribonuclease [Candidatus Nealsonbacteria bacterium]